MFAQNQIFRTVSPKQPIVVFVDFFVLRDASPPEGAVVNLVSEDGGEITITE